MKKLVCILSIIVATLSTSCGSDDDATTTTEATIANTIWDGQLAESGILSFGVGTFTLVEPGNTPANGTYTFNNNSGVLIYECCPDEPFSIENNILTLDRGAAGMKIYTRR